LHLQTLTFRPSEPLAEHSAPSSPTLLPQTSAAALSSPLPLFASSKPLSFFLPKAFPLESSSTLQPFQASLSTPCYLALTLAA